MRSIVTWLKKYWSGISEKDPAEGYDLWADNYDKQPDNLMLALDEQLFTDMLSHTIVKGKTMIDVGCGTGRHWGNIFSREPQLLIGYDVSLGMLTQLRAKFPMAQIYLSHDERLLPQPDQFADLLISTLTIAHIPSIEKTFTEWNRVVQPGGEIIITDYHPAALEKGGKRTFAYKGKTIAVRNTIHSIEKIRQLAQQQGWYEIQFRERMIDAQVRHFYEAQNALHLFDQFNGTPIIYGIHLKKPNDPS